jgi:nucleoid-associated protein YgaU
MGVWNFVKDAGERIIANAKAAAQFPGGEARADAAPAGGAQRSAQEETKGKGNGKDAGDAIESYIRALQLQIDNLEAKFEASTSTVHISGVAKDQATKEKVILAAGNIEGVEKVVDEISVKESAPPAQQHTVVKGDTLSAIAKKYYGDASQYPRIFEANKPMLKDPDKIYPGQSLRIPPKQ